MKKSQIRTHLASLFLAALMLFAIVPVFSTPVEAAYSEILIGGSPQPCKGNLSQYSFPPPGNPVQGDYYYLNLSATENFKFDSAEFFVQEPGASSFRSVYKYDAQSYFRWVNHQIHLAKAGVYKVRVTVTTLDGQSGTGEFGIEVAAKTTTATANTHVYKGTSFHVVPNFHNKWFFDQNNYPRFQNAAGKNRGCTAVAMATVTSILNNTTVSPNDVKWCSQGTSWEYTKRLSWNGKTYYGNTYTESEGLKAIFNCITDGKPIIVGVKGAGCDHVVSVVGVREGADSSNLSLSDFLIIDPWGGEVKLLSAYTGLDTEWALRIPIYIK